MLLYPLCLALVASALVNAQDEKGTLTATFSEDKENGLVRGFVDVISIPEDGVKFTMTLDLQNVMADDTYAECTDGAGEPGDTINLLWHIHEGKPKDGEGVKDECSAMAGVEGHYDPTYACGATSNQVEACEALGRTADSDTFSYNCNPETYNKNPYACQVADYSGKYGAAIATIQDDGTAILGLELTDPWGPPLDFIEGMTLVFHCGTPRIFCSELGMKSEVEFVIPGVVLDGQ